MSKPTWQWYRRPIIKKLTMQNIWEHTPLDYYRYGLYPRYISGIRTGELPFEWVKLYSDGVIAEPGQDYEEAAAIAKAQGGNP